MSTLSLSFHRLFPLLLFSLAITLGFPLVHSSVIYHDVNSNNQHNIGLRTLVIVEDHRIQQTHSKLFQSINARGHNLTFAHVLDDPICLVKHGIFNYDNLLFFAPTAIDHGDSLTLQQLRQFIDQTAAAVGVMIVVDERVSEAQRELISELSGIEMDEEGTRVIDYWHSTADSITSKQLLHNPHIFTPATLKSTIHYSGIAHTAPFITTTKQHIPLLTAESTAFSHQPNLPVTAASQQSLGKQTLLVSAVQHSNGARVVVSGSMILFSDAYWSENAAFIEDLTRWCTSEKAALRVKSVNWGEIGAESVKLQSYRVSTPLFYSIEIEVYDSKTRQWQPFTANDVQLEVIMLDPAIRTTLEINGNALVKRFQLPDVYGVYKLQVKYQRQGLAQLLQVNTISIRPYRHDEYPRFLLVAAPYYVSSFVGMAGMLLFGVVFLYSKEK